MVRTMNKSLIRSRWAAIGAAVAVTFGGGTFLVANAASAPSNAFFAITPCRLLDTRSDVAPVETSKVENAGIRKGVVQDKSKGNTVDNDITVIFDSRAKRDGSKFTLKYGNSDFRAIMGKCDAQFTGGDLAGASPTALLLNVTTVSMTANGFLTLYPWEELTGTGTAIADRPFYSNLNPISTLPSVSNNVTVMLRPIDDTLVLSDVACSSGTSWGNSDCQYDGLGTNDANRLNAFRLYNENGNTHVIIDVLGYYDGPLA